MTIKTAIEALERFRRTNDEDELNEVAHYLRELRPATEKETTVLWAEHCGIDPTDERATDPSTCGWPDYYREWISAFRAAERRIFGDET